MKISVYIATSLDGFIARMNGDIEWLTSAGIPGDTEDYGYYSFTESIDAIVMGRNTLEKVLSFPEWPYSKKVFILSNTLKSLPETAKDKAELFSGDLKTLKEKLELNSFKRIYIDGGKTIQSFLREGLVTDLTITRIPVLIGSGLPLFSSLSKDIKLKHIETKSYPSGFVQSKYEL
ncbi:MAG TPA: dihydrofolate reductase family protein [Leptospiraceae bacterium]|nr:dihydrofolate reductase family protein [Leptospiraceae bacterium]HMX33886.1 dihydrofolate reductase family protein [Leptospiraceae bacterium]HMY34199.1 dihydrofolate reductase family protein [Leptospiraceae bacterium]HMZ66417.1 dihydrofolate reductase family protein [Leptospiraceae bacterium]HNA09899.1 dihydrofolate reductase family protein [Leptospiraceae bacterium]